MREITNRNDVLLNRTNAIATEYPLFWSGYCKIVHRDIQVVPLRRKARPSSAGTCLWFSGGLESAVCKHRLEAAGTTFNCLCLDDYHTYFDEAIKHGITYEFIFARVGEILGYSDVIVGIEDDSLWTPRLTRHHLDKFEMDRQFFALWNSTDRDCAFGSLVEHEHKEDVLLYAYDHNIPFCSCDMGSTYCGECYKCFELWCYCTALGLQPPHTISLACFDRFHLEWVTYKEGNYTHKLNPYGTLQRYVRLKVMYGFDLDEARRLV